MKKGSQQFKNTSYPKFTPLNNILTHSIFYLPLFLIYVHVVPTTLLSPLSLSARLTLKYILVSNDYRNKHINNSDSVTGTPIPKNGIPFSHLFTHYYLNLSDSLSHLCWQQVLRTASERCPQVPKASMGSRFSAGLRKQYRHKLPLCKKIWFIFTPQENEMCHQVSQEQTLSLLSQHRVFQFSAL